jgi:hypothetical protein
MAGRKLHYYQFKGELKTAKEISALTGLHISTVRQRIYYGTPLELPKQNAPNTLKGCERVFLKPTLKVSSNE